jgi:hypothetical protein
VLVILVALGVAALARLAASRGRTLTSAGLVLASDVVVTVGDAVYVTPSEINEHATGIVVSYE